MLPVCSPNVNTTLSLATAMSGAPRYRFLQESPLLWKCWMLRGEPVVRFVPGSSRCAHRHGEPSRLDQKESRFPPGDQLGAAPSSLAKPHSFSAANEELCALATKSRGRARLLS